MIVTVTGQKGQLPAYSPNLRAVARATSICAALWTVNSCGPHLPVPVVDRVQLIAGRVDQVARGHLAVPGAGVEQRRRAGQVGQRPEQPREPDRLGRGPGQSTCDTQQEVLRGLRYGPGAGVPQQVAVVDGTQPEVLEPPVGAGVTEPPAGTVTRPGSRRPSRAASDHRTRARAVRWQVFGLVGTPAGTPVSYWPSLPGRGVSSAVSPAGWAGEDGGRSHLPLRGSPGFAPGSLLPRRRWRRHRTSCRRHHMWCPSCRMGSRCRVGLSVRVRRGRSPRRPRGWSGWPVPRGSRGS
jgi:hypothetical protein